MKRTNAFLALALVAGTAAACNVKTKENGNAPPAVEIQPANVNITKDTSTVVTPDIDIKKDTEKVVTPHVNIQPPSKGH